MALPHYLYDAIGEFTAKSEASDLKVGACFLWTLWVQLAEDPDIVPLLDGIETDFFDQLHEERLEPPELPLLRNIWNRPSEGERLKYLILQTIRVQHAAMALTSVIRGRTRPVKLAAISALPHLPREFYVLRRRNGKQGNEAALRRARVPRCVFPDLQIVPTQLSEKIKVELKFLPELGDLTGLEMRPSVYSSDAVYEVNLDPRPKDIYFRFEGQAKGATERTEEFWRSVTTVQARALDSALALIWPELSIDEATATEIGRRAAERTDPDAPPSSRGPAGRKLVLPGTFHGSEVHTVELPATTIAGVVNRACLLDVETGELVLEQDKIRPFKLRDTEPTLVEALAPADTLRIGVADWGTFCIMICKDFVDDRAPLVSLLDIDYIMVPSMGDIRTQHAWQRQAEGLKRRWGSRSALAMQAAPVEAEGSWKHTASDQDVVHVT